jgi:transcription elongation factor Elf1
MLVDTKVNCPRCRADVIVKVSNEPTVVNGPYVSLFLLQHPTHSTCGICGATVAPAIVGVKNLQVGGHLVEGRESEQRILVPGNGQ